ncbi:MAG: hypothetical protein MJB14_18730, partial [Spirochaetes bacterium]|nr:hypothetical protein [Spirochaetota bacterium]
MNQRFQIIKKSIFASQNNEEIENLIQQCINFITKQYQGNDQFLQLISLTDQLLIERVLKEKKYVNGFLKKVLNYYFSQTQTNFYDSWGILFCKILESRLDIYYPKVFSALFEVTFSSLPISNKMDELEFPLNE